MLFARGGRDWLLSKTNNKARVGEASQGFLRWKRRLRQTAAVSTTKNTFPVLFESSKRGKLSRALFTNTFQGCFYARTNIVQGSRVLFMDCYVSWKSKNRTLQFISRLRHICIRNLVLKRGKHWFCRNSQGT